MADPLWEARTDPSTHLVSLIVAPVFVDQSKFEMDLTQHIEIWAKDGLQKLEILLAPASHVLLIPFLYSLGLLAYLFSFFHMKFL
jgi:hypothetical protein